MEFEATAELLHRAQQGEVQATDELFRRYQPRLVHIVSLRLGQRLGEIRAEVEDIVQDALLDAFRGLREFEPRSEGALLHWLAELAMNRFRDRWRREHAQKRAGGAGRELGVHEAELLSSSILEGQVTTPSERLQGIELEQRLEQCLLALPEMDRQVIVMARLCGMEHAEIATALGLGTESSSRARLARALVSLSQCLGRGDERGRTAST